LTATKTDIARDMALAIAELRQHGGSEAQVEALRQQFSVLTENEGKPAEPEIPD